MPCGNPGARTDLVRLALLCALPGMLAAGRAAPPPAALQEQASPERRERSTTAERVLSAGLPAAAPDDLGEWPAGPVRYLLSSSEMRLYRSLNTEVERRAFIQQFWLRRDPDVASMENEFRFEFWHRVTEANRLFTRTTTPGWKTDRGKYYITLGPPDEVEGERLPNRRSGTSVILREEDGTRSASTMGGDSASDSFHGLERWTYRTPPGRNLPPNFVLAFRLKETGDYELSSDPRDASLFEGMLSVDPVALEPEVFTSERDAARRLELLQVYNDLAVAYDLGKLNVTPDPQRLLGELVTSEAFFGGIPFLLQTDYYRTEADATLCVFTVGIDPRALTPEAAGAVPDLMVVGRLDSLSDPNRSLLLAGDAALTPSPDNGGRDRLLLFQAVQPLAPGAYNATFGMLDRARGRIGSSRQGVRVPSFPATGLSISSLTLARSLAPLDVDAAGGATSGIAPFRIGNTRVVPRTDAVFRNGEEFSVYYQVYGARVDATTRTPRLDIVYRFFVLGDGGFAPVGEPIRQDDRRFAAQGWSFPLIRWPEASFRLEVTVQDRVSGEVVAAQVPFSIAEAPAPEGAGPEGVAAPTRP